MLTAPWDGFLPYHMYEVYYRNEAGGVIILVVLHEPELLILV